MKRFRLEVNQMRCESMREEGLLAKKMNVRSVVGRGEKSPLSDPGSELRVRREKGEEK